MRSFPPGLAAIALLAFALLWFTIPETLPLHSPQKELQLVASDT